MSHMVLAFDTLKYANKLKAVGFSEKQAEVQAEAIADLVTDDLATKRDLRELELCVKRDLQEMGLCIKRDLQEMELRIVVKGGGVVVGGLSMLVVLMKLFHL